MTRKPPISPESCTEVVPKTFLGVVVLALPTKKEAEIVVDTVVATLEATLLNNLETNGFTLKLGSFGKFYVRHKPGIRRKIAFSGQSILTKMRRTIKFVSLGALRQRERVE